jgi:hypothetical protein
MFKMPKLLKSGSMLKKIMFCLLVITLAALILKKTSVGSIFGINKTISGNELKNLIVNREVREFSLTSPNSYYKVEYNPDGSYKVDYMNNMTKVGEVTGKYSIDNSMNYAGLNILSKNVNMADAEFDSKIMKNKEQKWSSGPFEVLRQGDKSTTLKYLSGHNNKERIMMVYH